VGSGRVYTRYGGTILFFVPYGQHWWLVEEVCSNDHGGGEREYYRSLVLERLTNKNPCVLKIEVCSQA
jgi:hypothetical protein